MKITEDYDKINVERNDQSGTTFFKDWGKWLMLEDWRQKGEGGAKDEMVR